MKKEEAKKAFKKLGGRQGLTTRIIEIVKDMTEVDSYKRYTAGTGQLTVLAEISHKADDYLAEIVDRGAKAESDFALFDYHKPFLQSDGHVYFDETEPKRNRSKEELAEEYARIIESEAFDAGRSDVEKIMDGVQAKNAFLAGYNAASRGEKK